MKRDGYVLETVRGAKEFDSQADIYFGEKVIEIRIPWQLLNFQIPHKEGYTMTIINIMVFRR